MQGLCCFSTHPRLFELLAEKICAARMCCEYLWLTQNLWWEAGGSSAGWLWVKMVKVWQLCYTLRVSFTGGLALPEQNISSTVLSVGSYFGCSLASPRPVMMLGGSTFSGCQTQPRCPHTPNLNCCPLLGLVSTVSTYSDSPPGLCKW